MTAHAPPPLSQHPVNIDGDLLTLPCGQDQGQVDYGDLLEEDDPNFISLDATSVLELLLRANFELDCWSASASEVQSSLLP